jgi:peptidoglycan hydrolase CwlO-like protein
MPTTAQDLNDAYSELLNHLNDAYWAASDMATKDTLYGYIESVSGIITQLDSADLASRDDAYTTLVANVRQLNKQLDTLQQQINKLIARINTAATVISDIAKVLTVAAQLFPVV